LPENIEIFLPGSMTPDFKPDWRRCNKLQSNQNILWYINGRKLKQWWSNAMLWK